MRHDQVFTPQDRDGFRSTCKRQMEGVFIMSKKGKDYLIAQFVERYSFYHNEFFFEAVRLKLIKIKRMKRGRYANYGLVITGAEKAIRYFFGKRVNEANIMLTMYDYSIPAIEIRIKNKVFKTHDISDFFILDKFLLGNSYPFILRVIGRISDVIRQEGYLIGDPFSSASRSINFDVFDIKFSKDESVGWIVNIWVANRYLANVIEENLQNLPDKPARESATFHITIGSGKKEPITFNILQSQRLRRSNTMSTQANLQPFNTSIPGLARTTFPEFLQFLSEEAKKGRFWMVFDNLTDRCLFLTDNAEPGRLTVPSNQYIGVNRYEAWRDSFDDYHRLKHLLSTEKIAPSFEANMYRLDGSFAHFQKTCYLIEGLWETQCLASVSEGWELLRSATTNNEDF